MIWFTRFDSAVIKSFCDDSTKIQRGGAEFVALLIGVHALLRQIARDGRDADAFLAAIQQMDRGQNLEPDVFFGGALPVGVHFFLDQGVGEIRPRSHDP